MAAYAFDDGVVPAGKRREPVEEAPKVTVKRATNQVVEELVAGRTAKSGSEEDTGGIELALVNEDRRKREDNFTLENRGEIDAEIREAAGPFRRIHS